MGGTRLPEEVGGRGVARDEENVCNPPYPEAVSNGWGTGFVWEPNKGREAATVACDTVSMFDTASGVLIVVIVLLD